MDNNDLKKEKYRLQKALSQAESYLEIAKVEINRLQAENKKLKLECANAQFAKYKAEFEEFKTEIKAEAYKEFAERLKRHTRKMHGSDFSGEFWDKAVLVSEIDNLLKELVGA